MGHVAKPRVFHTLPLRLCGGSALPGSPGVHVTLFTQQGGQDGASTKVVSTRIGPQSSENEGISLQVFPGSPEERRVPYLILTGNNRETHEISTQRDVSKCEVAPTGRCQLQRPLGLHAVRFQTSPHCSAFS